MAMLTLTDDEKVEVRLQVGAWVTSTMLTDAMITAGTVLGTASDYVFEKVREGMNLEALTSAERLIAERFADETDDDIANFINTVLKPPQRQQMRRAVVFYSAGLCVPLVARVLREGAAGIDTERTILRTQSELFTLADAEINRLREAFPDDAFKKPTSDYNLFAIS